MGKSSKLSNRENQVKTMWFVPVKVKERFTKFCSETGSVAQDACAGALYVWSRLNPQVRESAIREALGQKPEVALPKNVSPEESDDLDEQIRALARTFAALTQKLERRASSSGQEETQQDCG
jgi:hypothetical protein